MNCWAIIIRPLRGLSLALFKFEWSHSKYPYFFNTGSTTRDGFAAE